MKTKKVEFSYPSSPNADKFGFNKGCYTVELVDADGFPEVISGHETLKEAMLAADSLPNEWYLLFRQLRSHWFKSLGKVLSV